MIRKNTVSMHAAYHLRGNIFGAHSEGVAWCLYRVHTGFLVEISHYTKYFHCGTDAVLARTLPWHTMPVRIASVDKEASWPFG